jgi:hypothetical protein
MSGLPPTADIKDHERQVRFVPKGDIADLRAVEEYSVLCSYVGVPLNESIADAAT